MKLVLLGPPGAGKGTQANILSEKLGISAISTGAMLRAAIRENMELGKEAQSYLANGQLVPDDLVVAIVNERLAKDDCKNGFILDGFPRTIEQAKVLDKSNVEVEKVLSIEVDDEAIVERLSGRRECEECSASYHVLYNPSKSGDLCEKCGGNLICRADDNLETIQKRLEVYHRETEPIKEYYMQQGKLVIAYGKEELEDTIKGVFSALNIEEM